MADTVTVRRSFKPGEILVEVVSVGLYGLTAAEVPIAPIAGLEASTVQGALEGIAVQETGAWEMNVYGSTTSGSPIYTRRNALYTVIGNMCTVSGDLSIKDVSGMTGYIRIKTLPFINKGIDAAATVGLNLGTKERVSMSLPSNSNILSMYKLNGSFFESDFSSPTASFQISFQISYMIRSIE